MKRSEHSLYTTGLIYHEDMLKHRCLWDNNHIETPERLKRSYEKCVERGLVDRCQKLLPRLARSEEIRSFHDEEHVSLFSHCDQMNEDQLNNIAGKFDDIYVCQESTHAAFLSAGCTIEAVKAVLDGRCDNSMALIRPPGHHASYNEANGFCLFNNVVIAAKKALLDYKLERILVVDWDVHHGQGTQRAFYDDPRVLYFSIHRYENGLFWPHLRESDWDHIGCEKGFGFNVNIPLNETNLGDTEYINIFLRVLMPMAVEFRPQLILVSAGYDAAIGCPEGRMSVTPACYGYLTRMLMSLSDRGKVCVILEGGYCLESLEESVAMTLRSLLGDPCQSLPPLTNVNPCVTEVMYNVTNLLQNQWSCFRSLHSFLNFVSDKRQDGRPVFTPTVSSYQGTPIRLDVYPTKNKYLPRDEEEINRYQNEIAKIIASYNFDFPEHFVAFGYDKEVQSHFDRNKDSLEGPYRVEAVMKKLKHADLLKSCNVLPPGRRATREELNLVHDLKYIDQVQSANDLLSFGANDCDPTYVNKETFVAASAAVGVCLNVVDSVLNGESQSGFAVVRPPGHLASQSTGARYCIFNNVAIAAKYAMKKYNVEKILIVDWDMNFGEGTFDVFTDDRNVLTVSLHGHRNDVNAKGGPGNVANGSNANICWKPSTKRVTDKDYIFALFNIVLPLAYSFSPDLIFVSAGFGVAETKELQIEISPWCYAYMTYLLGCLSRNRVILVLEEGYHVDLLKQSVISCLKTFTGFLPSIPNFSQEDTTLAEQLQTLSETVDSLNDFWHLV